MRDKLYIYIYRCFRPAPIDKISATAETHKNKFYLVTSMLANFFRSWYVATCKIEVPSLLKTSFFTAP
jgi:hypothetical protein